MIILKNFLNFEQGLDFLVTACESEITCHLSDDEFIKFKESVSQCVHHIIGSLDPTSKSQSPSPIIRRISKNSSEYLSLEVDFIRLVNSFKYL